MKNSLIIFLLAELAYVASARLLTRTFTGSPLQLELYWSGLRLVSAAVLAWLVFFRKPFGAPPRVNRSPRLLVATGIFLAPLLVGENNFPASLRPVFAATSLLVGLREELAYRGMLQTFLTNRFGLLWALCFSNLAFVAYHFGVQPFTLHYVIQIFLVGTLLGLVYHHSGSLLLVIVLHTIYDAIDAYSPFLTRPLPDFACTVILVSTLLAFLVVNRPWAFRGGR